MSVALGLVLTAASCGGDDGAEGAPTDATVDAATQGAIKDALSKPTSTTGATTAVEAPTSYEDWEQLWADERAAAVKKIEDNGWGTSADGKTLSGPEGFTVDLSQCAGGWSNTEGLTDTEIKIGTAAPLSGPAADSGNVNRTADAWLQYQSQRGLFEDATGKTRSTNFILRDDGYDVARTLPLVDELLDSEKVFTLWTTGTPSGLKIYDKISERCVPHPLVIGGSPAWGDPQHHPWTTGSQISYSTETVIWGTFVDEHIDELTADDGKATVVALVANSDFGATYESSFRAVLEQSANRDEIELITEKAEITTPNLTDPMTTLGAKQPDVFLTMTGGAPCTQIITEAANNGMKDAVKYKFLSSQCKSSALVGKDKVGGDGSASNGWYIVGGGFKDFNADALASDPFVAWGREFLAERGYDYKLSSSFGQGFYYGWLLSQTLAIAGQLDGGLTRSNFLLALRSFEGTSPVHLEGIEINMNGNQDAFFVEGSDLSVYDSAQQLWIGQEGGVIELSGKSPTCSWDQAASACR